MSVIINGTDGVQFNDSSLQGAAASPFGLKNRIINGDMRIDQRNAGASVTANDSVFGVDRFRYSMTQSSKGTSQQNAGSVTTPAGFTNYLGFTSSSAYSVLSTDYFAIQHRIEGFNIADFAWGTVNAKSITLSFWVYSSLTGTFGGNLNNGSNRFYVFSYSIPVANTWTQISITISGDTSGSWTTNNGIGLVVGFGLGVGSTYSGTAGSWGGTAYYSATGAQSVVGTNGATFYITGVQLEVGSSATPFERRMYGQELALCQRYYFKTAASSTGGRLGAGHAATTTTAYMVFNLPVPMRISPTALEQSGTASHYGVNYLTTGLVCSIVPSFVEASSTTTTTTLFTVGSAVFTAGHGVEGGNANSSGFLAWSAEL